ESRGGLRRKLCAAHRAVRGVAAHASLRARGRARVRDRRPRLDQLVALIGAFAPVVIGLSGWWRRGRDSNPRYTFWAYTHFPGVRLQPLGHLSRCEPEPGGRVA